MRQNNMAVMIPIECDLSRRPMSEQIVFEVIKKNLSNEWYVFHSFDYVTRDLNKKRWDGEIDFLLYHPQKGMLVIEVKGGAISYRNGQWYQEDRPIDPVEQAKRNKYAVMRLLQDSLHRAVPVKFAHSVCFPSCGVQNIWPAEAQEIVLTGDGLPYIEHFASKILADTQIPANLYGTLPAEEILRVLSPVFEYGKKLSERIHIEEKQFFLFTEQQCAILDALENFPRLQINGCAGSGKTIMAIKKAQKLAAQGANVLFLCFNQLLAEHLRREVKAYPAIKAAAFFEFCIELLKIPEEQAGQQHKKCRPAERLILERSPHITGMQCTEIDDGNHAQQNQNHIFCKREFIFIRQKSAEGCSDADNSDNPCRNAGEVRLNKKIINRIPFIFERKRCFPAE